MTDRSHSTCEDCRAGVYKSDAGVHYGTGDGGVEQLRRCTAQCSHCLGTINPKELFREIRTPVGTVEVHESCMG